MRVLRHGWISCYVTRAWRLIPVCSDRTRAGRAKIVWSILWRKLHSRYVFRIFMCFVSYFYVFARDKTRTLYRVRKVPNIFVSPANETAVYITPLCRDEMRGGIFSYSNLGLLSFPGKRLFLRKLANASHPLVSCKQGWRKYLALFRLLTSYINMFLISHVKT